MALLGHLHPFRKQPFNGCYARSTRFVEAEVSASGRLPPVSRDSRMAAFDFSAAQAVASMADEQQASVPIQSLLMQINADAVCLVRTQF